MLVQHKTMQHVSLMFCLAGDEEIQIIPTESESKIKHYTAADTVLLYSEKRVYSDSSP